jgi:hypothetical protein
VFFSAWQLLAKLDDLGAEVDVAPAQTEYLIDSLPGEGEQLQHHREAPGVVQHYRFPRPAPGWTPPEPLA